MAKQRTLGAIVYDDFELLDLYGPLEMFGNIGPELRIVTIGEKSGAVRSVQGPATVAEFDFESSPALDLLLLPGGIGTVPQLANARLLDFLQRQSERTEILMSVCSGSAILAAAGLLDGKRATSNKQFFELASSQSTNVTWVENARWVEDGPVFTSSGVSAGTDMSLGVIERLYGRERAEQIAVMTEYEWHSDPANDPFAQYLNQGNIEQYLAALGR